MSLVFLFVYTLDHTYLLWISENNNYVQDQRQK